MDKGVTDQNEMSCDGEVTLEGVMEHVWSDPVFYNHLGYGNHTANLLGLSLTAFFGLTLFTLCIFFQWARCCCKPRNPQWRDLTRGNFHMNRFRVWMLLAYIA